MHKRTLIIFLWSLGQSISYTDSVHTYLVDRGVYTPGWRSLTSVKVCLRLKNKVITQE